MSSDTLKDSGRHYTLRPPLGRSVGAVLQLGYVMDLGQERMGSSCKGGNETIVSQLWIY